MSLFAGLETGLLGESLDLLIPLEPGPFQEQLAVGFFLVADPGADVTHLVAEASLLDFQIGHGGQGHGHRHSQQEHPEDAFPFDLANAGEG